MQAPGLFGDMVVQMWDINTRSMQSKCKVFFVPLLASLLVGNVYLFYQFNLIFLL